MENIKGTDIYLLDQILKDTYSPTHKILDAGCGSGRNMRWFAKNGYSIYGCDLNSDAVEIAMENTHLAADKFKISRVENMPYVNDEFDHIICNAVLHFAENEKHFLKMISEIFRVLKPGGTFFVRMTSTFGLPQNYRLLEGGQFLLADESVRFLLTEKLFQTVKSIGFQQLEPVKSVLVEKLRSMTTLVLRKIA